MNTSLAAGFLLSALTIVACAAPATEDTDDVDQEVVGVTDLSPMEAQLGLVKDTKNAHGVWSRGDAKLTKGRCYKKTIGSADGASWELRRYTKGAAFFHKLGTAPATNDYRPVTCVDVDSSVGPATTVSLSGVLLDAVLRYKLGAGFIEEGAAGHVFRAFDRGELEVADGDRYCDFRYGNSTDEQGRPAPWSFDPPVMAGRLEAGNCVLEGEDATGCYDRGLAACKAAAKKDVAQNTLARPSNDGMYIYYLGLQPSQSISTQIAPSVLELAYRVAMKTAKNKDIYSEATDPVGGFVKNDVGPAAQHTRFAKVDVHFLTTERPDGGYAEQLFVTPKNSDAAIAQKATVKCTRTVVANQSAPDFACTGL